MALHSPVIDRRLRVSRARKSLLRAAHGFTLIECLIASVVLSIAVLGASVAMTVGAASSEHLDSDAPALSIARQLMEETESRPFDPPASGNHVGWAGRNRNSATYDDIGDFNGYNAIVFTQSTSADGSLVENSASFSKAVSVEFRSSPDGDAVAGGDFALITVTVTPSDDGNPVMLYRMASRYTKG